jgi:hypothetical protein
MSRALLLALLGAAGCNLVAGFDLSRVTENTDVLCSDGIDNDANGLTDCQDLKCLSQPSCCKFPTVVLADDFARPACAATSCDAPDPSCTVNPSIWQSWGKPTPLLCGGGLTPIKTEICYDVGALASPLLPLHPGLVVSVSVAGIPELAGRLIVGLTLQDQVSSGTTDCSPTEGLTPVLSAMQVRTQNGYFFQANFADGVIGSSTEIDDDGSHELRLAIGDDHRMTWQLDGKTFATSPANEPFDPASSARLALAGRGQTAHFLGAKVSDGTQCDTPGSWTPSPSFLALDAAGGGAANWDSFEVYDPAVTRVGSQVLLFYTGCAESALGGTCGAELGGGLATSDDEQTFTRAPANPLEFPVLRSSFNMGVAHDDSLTAEAPLVVWPSNPFSAAKNDQEIFWFTTTDQMMFTSETNPSLSPGSPGSWDDAQVCCVTAVPSGNQLLIWFAGRSTQDPVWRIGLARSTDGGMTFVEDPHNPVLGEGASDAFDGYGASDPEVVFDAQRSLYRLWYEGRTFLGETSIGYAVSTDGIHWHKWPDNPVLRPQDVGLEEVGSPAVLVDEGELRLWVHGRVPGSQQRRIYSLENRGQPPM